MARKRVPAAEARAAMKDLVDAVKNRNERIKITRYGKTVAYLVPAKDGEALENCADELAACAQRTALLIERKPRAARANGADNGLKTRSRKGAGNGTGKRPVK